MLIHQTTNSMGNYNYNAFTYENCQWYFHFHNNFELVYVLSGELTAQIDTHTETLSAGDFALILPSQLHAFDTPKESRVWIGVFSGDYIAAFSSQMNRKVGERAKFSCDSTIRDYILHLLIDEGTNDIYLLKSCFYAVCQQYLKNVTLIPQQFDNNDLLSKIVDYVSSNFKSNLTLKQMAHDLGFEYHYLSRRFHSIFAMNFNQFVNQYRANHARELLAENFGSISEIAFESGFQSVRSFNGVYKELFQSTPRQLRSNTNRLE